ncbi:hypothetical protein NE237_018884 [Protea cynaroides]|uniref:Uncharacterized protein n=1 Tax=Protea cynaroides TaxID=273540 RepID=A0A9Q0QPF5_9MAGN|nr:hypothetical protein NE237_018884 [Protea cynaroides]
MECSAIRFTRSSLGLLSHVGGAKVEVLRCQGVLRSKVIIPRCQGQGAKELRSALHEVYSVMLSHAEALRCRGKAPRLLLLNHAKVPRCLGVGDKVLRWRGAEDCFAVRFTQSCRVARVPSCRGAKVPRSRGVEVPGPRCQGVIRSQVTQSCRGAGDEESRYAPWSLLLDHEEVSRSQGAKRPRYRGSQVSSSVTITWSYQGAGYEVPSSKSSFPMTYFSHRTKSSLISTCVFFVKKNCNPSSVIPTVREDVIVGFSLILGGKKVRVFRRLATSYARLILIEFYSRLQSYGRGCSSFGYANLEFAHLLMVEPNQEWEDRSPHLLGVSRVVCH